MTTPSEAAQAPSPFYNSRPTRGSSSQATTQLTHGVTCVELAPDVQMNSASGVECS